MNVNVQEPIDLGKKERLSDSISDVSSRLPTSEHSPSAHNNNQPNIEKDFSQNHQKYRQELFDCVK